MRASFYKQFVGKKVEWEYAHDHNRGTCMVATGTVERVEGKNVWVKPHKVGDASKGYVFHDYQVMAK